MNKLDTEYKILKIFEDNPNATQRQIARDLNVSLGKTNYIVRALIDRGWIKLSNFKRSDNKLGYIYLLTPKVIAEKSMRSKKILRKKSEEYNKLKKEIEMLKKER